MQKVETPGKTTVYAYDGAGNRISQDETYTSEQTIAAIEGTGISEINYIIKRSEYIYGNTNTLLKLSEKMKNEAGAELLQKITTFRYDKNGNEQRRTVEYITLYNKENPKAYEAAVYNEDTTKPIHAVVDQTVNNYDGFNRLIKTEIIKMGVRTTVEYTYNGDGLRIEKTIKRSDKENTAKTTNYLYDRQHVILEERENDEIKYVRGINYIARIDDTGKLSYYLYNGHGDVVQTINENGQTENQYDYDIFGNPTLTIEEYENNIRYAGEFYDAETGLYYLRARYYDPYIGRFISEDSYWGEDINPLSLNLYTYCYNDPIKYIDPTGHIVSAWDEKHLTKAEQDKIQKYTNDWEAAYKVGNKKGMEDAHASAEKIRDGKRSENEIGTGDGNTITIGFGGNSSNSTSSGTSSSSGKSGGSSGNDAAKQQVEQARLKAEAQIAEILKDNEKAKDLINLIKAKEISYDAAIQAGKNSEAELYAQGAQILLQKLKEQTEKEKNKTLAENLLSIGDKGDAVKDLQKLLIGAGIYKVEINGKTRYLEEDGDFGKITQAAVKVYQEKKGLTVDGIAGPQTLKSLIGSNYNKYAEILDKMQFGKGQYNNDKEEAQRLANTMGTGNAGPTLTEAAIIAENIYTGNKGDKPLDGSWELVKDVRETGGLRTGVYGRKGADGKMEYVIANAGTDLSNWQTGWSDMKNNIQQPFGKSKDMQGSLEYAKSFVGDNSDASITFVGHSKGGAEAAANAVATNRDAILFNPATVNLRAYNIDKSEYNGKMTTYIVKGEILNRVFGAVSKPIDDVVYLPRQHWDSIENHYMDAVKQAIIEYEKRK